MKRLSATFPEDLANDLEELSKFTDKSISSIIVEKVKVALDLDEDAYWLKIVEEREKDGEESYLSHEEVWAHLK